MFDWLNQGSSERDITINDDEDFLRNSVKVF